MRALPLRLATAGLAVALLGFPATAHALDFEIAARAGTAISNVGPLGFGIGARGGLSLQGLYLGIDFIDYLGATSTCDTCSAPAGASLPKRSQSALLYGLEAGYSFRFSLVTIRPRLGLGDFRLSSSLGGGPRQSSDYFYLEPGVVGLVSIGPVFVGVDVNALLPPTGPEFALTVHGQIGISF